MSDLPLGAIACAVAAAVFFAVAAVMQQHAAARVPEDEPLLGNLLRNPRWWAGFVGDGGGFGFQVAALALGSVLVVQPILVSSLIFALPLAAHYSGHRISGRMWATAFALGAALACFLIVGDPTAGRTDASMRQWFVPMTALLVVVAVIVAAGIRVRDAGRQALLLGVAGGTLFGLAAALTEQVTGMLDRGIGVVAGSWQTYTLVAAGMVGLYLQQRAFQAGPLAASLPAVMVTEPVAGAVMGMAALDERLRTGPLGIVVIAGCVVVMGLATVVLSRAQAENSSVVSTRAVPAGTDSPV